MHNIVGGGAGEIVHKICSGSQKYIKCIVLSTELFSTGFAQLRNIYNFSCCLARRMGCITALQLLKITLLFCISPPFIYGTTEYYVMPTEYHGIPCPGEPCHTLNYYARNIPKYAWSDVVVRFLPGNHSLNQSFCISKKRNLQLTSFYPDISVHTGNVTIHCTSEANFHFQHASNVTIVGLLFITEPVASILSGTLMFDATVNFRIQEVIVQNWKRQSNHSGNTIYLQNTLGKSTISDSEFHEFKSSGNVGSHIYMSDFMHGNNLKLAISNCTFSGAPMSAADILLKTITSVFIEISDSSFISNKRTGILFDIHNTIATVHITNCLVTQNKQGGLYFDISLSIPKIQIVITNSIISKN